MVEKKKTIGSIMTKHCCERIVLALNNRDNPVEYNAIFREYGIRLIKHSASLELIAHCPWCAVKLLPSLRKNFFKIVESQYGIEDDGFFDLADNSRLPEEFHSDKWWKKRKL